MSGGTSYDQLARQLRAAVGDKTIRNIVLDVDSPGGSVAGNTEFAREVLRARRVKPVIAQAQYTMASAAYQLASAATQIVAAPSAKVGSIGTYSIHNDLSAALAQMGIKRTYIASGTGKTDGNETEPLSAGALERIQGAVRQAYDMFVNTVVRGRGGNLTPEKVEDVWQAHVYSAADAKDLGMIDKIATLDETLESLLEGSGDPADVAALLEESAIADTPQDPIGVSGQDWRRDVELARQAYELEIATL
jgi:signal peptide peptidase SppA